MLEDDGFPLDPLHGLHGQDVLTAGDAAFTSVDSAMLYGIIRFIKSLSVENIFIGILIAF